MVSPLFSPDIASIDERLLQRITEESNTGNLSISASFHLEKAPIEEFINKSLLLKGKGVGVWVSAVAHPKYLAKMPTIRDRFEKKSLGIGFFPFIGKYRGRNYPAEYSGEELKIIRELPGWHEQTGGPDQMAIELPKVKGIRCYAGVKYIFVNPSGEVFRCIPVGQVMGNIFEGGFSTFRTPAPCPVEICDCELYWKYHMK
jgi:MoaA/NifB/PqqE/SkfB family radical SAM enzyme